MLQFCAVDPFEMHRLGLSVINPARRTRRQIWLEIYLPFGLAALLLGALALLIRRAGVGTASLWADIALTVLLGAGLVIGLMILLAAAAAAVGVWYLVRLLPEPFSEARSGLARARYRAREASDAAARAVILPSAGLRALRAVVQHLGSIFRR